MSKSAVIFLWGEAVTWHDDNWFEQVRNLNTFIASIYENDIGLTRRAIDSSNPDTAWIISMWTSQESRGKKVASRLLETIITWAKDNQVKILKLNVVDSNEAAILRI